MHRAGHKTRKVKRKLRYTKRRSLRLRRQRQQRLRRQTGKRRVQRGGQQSEGLVPSIVTGEGILLEEGYNPPVEVRVGGKKEMVSYSTYLRDFKGLTEQELD